MFCPNCGKQLEDSSKFCPYCGEKTGQASVEDIPAITVESTPENLRSEPTTESAPVKAEPPVADIPVPVHPVQNAEKKKKGGKGKAVIIALVVLIVAAAAAAAVFFLGDKGAADGDQAGGDAAVEEYDGFVLYIKDNDLYISFTDSNTNALIMENVIPDGAERYQYQYNFSRDCYYKKETGYLYYSQMVIEDGYYLSNLCRVKIDGETVGEYELLAENISRFEPSYISPDDSKIFYTKNGDLYMRHKEHTILESEDSWIVAVDYENDICYYSENDTELHFITLSSRRTGTVYESDDWLTASYVGDGYVVVEDGYDTILVDREGNLSYPISSGNDGGYISKYKDGEYYYISYSYLTRYVSDYVSDDCKEADALIGPDDAGYEEKYIRDSIRKAVNGREEMNLSNYEIYHIKDGKFVRIADGASDTAMYSDLIAYNDYTGITQVITISEIYAELEKLGKLGSFGVYDVREVIRYALEKKAAKFIVYKGEVSPADDGYYYISDVVYNEENNMIYYHADGEMYVDGDFTGTSYAYKAEIGADNKLTGITVVVEGADNISDLIGDELVAFKNMEFDENRYIGVGDLYVGEAFVDSDVDISYLEGPISFFGCAEDGLVIYTKNNNFSEFECELYCYENSGKRLLAEDVASYIVTGNTLCYYVADGKLMRHDSEAVLDSGNVMHVFLPEMQLYSY